MSTASLPVVHVHEFGTDQPVRWCPGCGDFSVLEQLKQAMAMTGIPRERIVFVSGMGCAGRTPYYLNTFGFHTIAGKAPAVATGLRAARPDLSVWVITGDGDALSVGGNHLLQAVRRNSDIKIVMLNNEIMGWTRGQASPTSRLGTRTKTTPEGSAEGPLRPLSVVLAAEATFAARSIDVDADHLRDTLVRAAKHRGSAFVEVYQNCHVYNDGVFEYATDHGSKPDTTLYLEHGKPLLFGKDRNRGIRLSGVAPEAVSLGQGMPLDDILVHNETNADPATAWILSRMCGPELPECFGVFRAVERPTFEDVLRAPPPRRAPSLAEVLTGDEAFTGL
ncbi:MAG: 2-oxoacid:ferredoxin oxidoreductase subunit beta [Gemmataceae bacterium]